MTREEGIKEINEANWIKDEHGILNLFVETEEGRAVHAWLHMRPTYCDRGHIQLVVDGPLNIDYADSFPRFFFSEEEAKEHTRCFLLWRLWKYRVHNPQLNASKNE